MRKQRFSQGFTAVELLVTLFVAAAFLIAGYQLYNVIIKDGGQTRAQTRAANVAYDYMRRYSNTVTNPCSAPAPTSLNPTIANLTSVTVTVTITCPYSASSGLNNTTNVSLITVKVAYNNPSKSVQYATYVKK